jgi:23S rRNA A1618 N6-methylase RlmF
MGDPFNKLRSAVHNDIDLLRRFAGILLASEQTKSLGDDIKDEIMHERSSVSTTMCNNQALPQYEITDNTIVISETHQDKFDLMTGIYLYLTNKIVDLVIDKVKSVENLIDFIKRNQLMECHFDKNDSIKSVMEKLRQDTCNILNIHTLEMVAVQHYKIEEAEKEIKEYKREVEKFCCCEIANIIDRKLLDRVVLRFESVKFRLEWSPKEEKIEEIKRLLKKAFIDDYLRQRVIVIEVTTGNSITIICYAPHHLMDILLVEAEGNIDQLKEMGLIHLTIGYYTVYDNTNDKVIEKLTNEIEDRVKEVTELEETVSQLTDKLMLDATEKETLCKEIEQLKQTLKDKEGKILLV